MTQQPHSRLNQWTDAFPRVAGATAIAVGSIVLLGWLFDIPILMSLSPDMVSMKANAAIAFGLAGMSMLLHSVPGAGKRRRTARFLASLVFLIGLATVLEYAFRWDAGIDELLFQEQEGTVGTFMPGRMPLNAALNFCFFGLALLMIKKENRWSLGLVQVLALVAGFLGVLGLLATTYGVSGFSGYAVFARMALHGAGTFIVLSVGVLCLHPDVGIVSLVREEGPAGYMARRLTLAAFAVPVVLGWIVAQGEMSGLYGPQFGDVIDAAAYVAIFALVVWIVGRSLLKLDAERRRLEQTLRQSEKEFKDLFDDAPVGYHELDAEGRYARINQTELRSLGYQAEEMLGHFCWEFVREREESKRSALAKLSGEQDPAKNVERLFLRKDGTTINVIIEDQILRDRLNHITGIRTTVQDITKLKRAQELLRESQEMHRTVLQNLAEGVGIVDGDERFRLANGAAEIIFGVPAGSLVGRGLREFMDPVEFKKMQAQTIKRRKGETASYEMHILRPDGEKRYLLASVCPSFEDNGNFLGSVGVFRDITLDKMSREFLVEKEKATQLNADIAALWIQNEALPTILQQCVEAMVLHFDAAFARIWTLNQQENVLELQASAGMYTHLDGPHGRVPVGKFKIGLIASERTPHQTNDVVGDPRVGDQEWARREGMVSFAGYPLLSRGEVVGVVAFFARRQLSELVVNNLEIVAERIAVGIERKRSEETLRATEARFRMTVENATDLIYNLDSLGTITSANPATSRLLGYSQNEIIGRRYLEFVTPEFQKRAERQFILQWKRKTPSVYYEAPVLTKDGRKLWFGQNVELIFKDGEAVGFLAVSRDITELKRADELLKQSVSLLQATLESTADGILVVDKSGKIESYNEEFARMWMLPDEIVESRDSDRALNHVLEQLKDPEAFISKVKELYAHPDERSLDLLEFKDGKVFERYSLPQRIDGAPVGRVWSFRDITERKRAMEELHNSREDLYRLLNSMVEGSYGVDTNGNCTFVNRAFLEMLGYQSEQDLLGKQMHEIIHHSHVDGSPYPSSECKMYRAYLTGQRVNVSDEVFWRKDGVAIPVEYWSHPILKDGVVIGSMATFVDITERRKAEQEIKLLAHTMASTRDCVSIGDLNDRFMFVNDAFIQTYGYTRTELMGQPFSIVRSEKTAREIAEGIFDGTLSEGWHGEIYNRRKDGSEFPIELWTSIVKDDAGKVVATVGVARDITERKRAEDALTKSTNLFRLVSNLTTDYIFVDRVAEDGKTEPDLLLGAVEQITGYTEEEYRAIGGWSATVHPDDRERDDRDFKELLSNKTIVSDIRTFCKDGSMRWMKVYAHPIWDEKAHRVVGISGAVQDISAQKQAEHERESLISELKTALEHVRTLGGLIPICAHCKKIRDDKGYWNQLEKYLGDHTDAKLTHGLCPDCVKLYFPGITPETFPDGTL